MGQRQSAMSVGWGKCAVQKLVLIVVMTCISWMAMSSPAVIYVNQTNTLGPWDGSLAHPFRLITNALDALALSNAVERGGHTISVASGRYAEFVYIYTNMHAGTLAAPNTLLGVGNPVIDAEGARAYCVQLHMATNFVIKGFSLTGATASGIRLDNGNLAGGGAENWKFDSCCVYNNPYGLDVNRHYMNGIVFTNCAFLLNSSGGIYFQSSSDAQISQCVFLFNGNGQASGSYPAVKIMGGGILAQNSVFAGNSGSAAQGAVTMNNCIFYENGGYMLDWGANQVDSVEDISRLGYGTNNIAADPCFASIGGFDFRKVYAGSPCIGNGVDGANIGLLSPAIVPVSHNTYYVNTNGSDGYTMEQAQNPATPWQTIQAGVSRSLAGDTLRIAAGTYVENVVITNSGTSDNPLSLIADGNVVIDGTASAFYLYRAAGILLDGFEIVSCTTAGLDIQESYGCRLRNLNVHSGVIGVLLHIMTGRNHFYKCVFYGHSAAGLSAGNYIGGQDYESCDFRNNPGMGVTMNYHCTISRFYNCNFNYNGTIGYRQSQTTMPCFLKNCNFVGNGTYGIESWYGARPLAENCNITGNGIYGAYENTGGTTYFTDCNFYANVSGLLYDRPTTTVITNIDDLNAFPGNSDNIETDPMFVDAAAGDLRLNALSGCIDAGTTNSVLLVDYYGSRRRFGPAIDIGIHELSVRGTIITVY